MSTDPRFAELRSCPSTEGCLVLRGPTGGDLLTHEIIWCTSERETPLAFAVQVEPLGDWPASPPLQSWQAVEDGQGDPVLLATGQAGTSHWSLAVTRVAPAGLRFDVACRVAVPPDFVGSTYRVAGSVPSERFDGLAVSIAGSPLAFRPSDRAECGSRILPGPAPDIIQIIPRAEMASGRCTLRWAYDVGVEPT